MISKGNDLDVLRKEYRNMELTRKAFADESNTVLRKQQQTLDMLRKEKEELKSDISALHARITMKPLNSFEQHQLDKLNTEINRYKHAISNEKRKIHDMKQQISVCQDQVWRQRRAMGGANAAMENQRLVEKQVRILENRLDQAIVKFNKSSAHNRNLRQEIDDLRGERITFDSVYKKIQQGLQDKRKQIDTIIEQSNLAYEQRDRAQTEIDAIEVSNRKEQEQFELQMEELGLKLESEMKAAAEKRKKFSSANSIISEQARLEAERKAAEANTLSREKEVSAQKQREKMQNFEEAFNKIAASTGVSDIDDLVNIFIDNEEQNFSLYSYANEQANEIAKLNDQIQALGKEYDGFANVDQSNDNGDVILNTIIEKIDKTESQAKRFEQRCSESQSTMDSLKDGIKILLTRLECNTEDIGELAVTEANILHYLGVIEKRTNQILNKYNMTLSRSAYLPEQGHPGNCEEEDMGSKTNYILKDTNNLNVLGCGPVAPMGGLNQIHINPPKLTDYSSDDDSEGACDASNISRIFIEKEGKEDIIINAANPLP